MNRFAFLQHNVAPTQPATVDAPQAEPQFKETPMADVTPVSPALTVSAPTATAPTLNKFESFLSKFGKILREIQNGTVNIAIQQEQNFDQIIPPAMAANLHTLIVAAASQVAASDAKYDQIGKADVPYAVKVVDAVAISGGTFLVLAAKLGFTIPQAQLGNFFGAAGQIASSLNLTNITADPTVPPAA